MRRRALFPVTGLATLLFLVASVDAAPPTYMALISQSGQFDLAAVLAPNACTQTDTRPTQFTPADDSPQVSVIDHARSYRAKGVILLGGVGNRCIASARSTRARSPPVLTRP